MKKLFIGITLVFVSTGIFAQTATDYLEVVRDALKTEKKAAIADVMELTDQESDAFWALYNEYNGKTYIVNTKLFNSIKDFANSYENMTDEKAGELWKEHMSIESELHKLSKTYFKKFDKILPTTKAVRYFQAENKIKNMVNAELSELVPFFE